MVVAALVVLSLTLITVSFREPAGGALHDAQSTAATLLRPFEVAVERVARPFRDLYAYFDELIGAKEENARLRRDLARTRSQLIQNEFARQENVRLRRLLAYRDSATFPTDYGGVAATVISRPPGEFKQQIGISAGSADGVRRYDPVVTELGLIGQVTAVSAHTAQVTLLTDETSAVSAVDLRTKAAGLVRHGQGPDESLILDRVSRREVVRVGDDVITAGWRSGKLASLYPRGIPIGEITYVGGSDTDLYQQVQIEPFADFSTLHDVLVLVKKRRR